MEQKENIRACPSLPRPARPLPTTLTLLPTIAACGGDARQAVKALIVANGFLESQVEKLQASVSTGYARGRLDRPKDCKDW